MITKNHSIRCLEYVAPSGLILYSINIYYKYYRGSAARYCYRAAIYL